MLTTNTLPAAKQRAATPESDRGLMERMQAMAREIREENEKLKAVQNPSLAQFNSLFNSQMRYIGLYLTPEALAGSRHMACVAMGLKCLHNFIRGGQAKLHPREPVFTCVPWPPALIDLPKGKIDIFVQELKEMDPDLYQPFADETITLAN
jgi:hypothetical protein